MYTHQISTVDDQTAIEVRIVEDKQGGFIARAGSRSDMIAFSKTDEEIELGIRVAYTAKQRGKALSQPPQE